MSTYGKLKMKSILRRMFFISLETAVFLQVWMSFIFIHLAIQNIGLNFLTLMLIITHVLVGFWGGIMMWMCVDLFSGDEEDLDIIKSLRK